MIFHHMYRLRFIVEDMQYVYQVVLQLKLLLLKYLNPWAIKVKTRVREKKSNRQIRTIEEEEALDDNN